MDAGGSTDMTLAFELEALKALDDPKAAVEGARQWSQYVGVLSEEPTYVVTNFTRKHGIQQDFFSGPRGKTERLGSLRGQPEFQTERYVFIGDSDEDETLADRFGWEYLDVEDAADAAGWELTDDPRDDSISERTVRDDWP